MFEQEISNQGTPSQDQPEEPLFDNYEMRSWKFSTRIYQVFAVSLLFNLIAIFGLGQSNLLTVKGCDSPLIGGVCDVLDTVYVGSKLFGTEGGYVDEAYTNTVIGPDDEITYIEIKDEPLYYPANYFEIANANEPKDPEIIIPGINDGPIAQANPTFPTLPPLEARPQVTPTPNDNVILGPLPDEDDNNTGPTPPLQRPGKGVNRFPRDRTVGAKTTPTPVAPPTIPTDEQLAETKLNKRPGYDFGYHVIDRLAVPDTKLDLSKPFAVQMNGVLTDEGKLDGANSKFVKEEGDEEMKTLAKQAIETINNMGVFNFLKQFDVNKFKFTLVQDDTQIYAVIESNQQSPERARGMANGLSKAISLAKMMNSNDEDTVALLKAATVTPKGKSFVINFAFPKEDAQALIKRQLEKAAARRIQEEEEKKNLSNPVSVPGSVTGVK